jgi:branched-chain amino acid transport system permease protein
MARYRYSLLSAKPLTSLTLLGLALLYLVLPEYGRALLARLMILAVYSYGYAVTFHMLGVMSLGHASLFASGMYGAGLYALYFPAGGPVGSVAAGLAASLVASIALGVVTLRTRGPYMMVATLLASQALYLLLLHFNEVTGGEQGVVLPRELTMAWQLLLLGLGESESRYLVSLAALSGAAASVSFLSSSKLGRTLVAMRDDEERVESLGYDRRLYRLAGFAVSGLLSGLSGALYVLMYGYMGAGFAGVMNSVQPILWVLAGGPSILIGPLAGCLAVTLLSDLAGGLVRGHVLVVGLGLVAIALAARRLSSVARTLGRVTGHGG